VKPYLSSIYSGVKACTHSKAVPAVFVAWKNARAKALYIGESLVKPAAVKIARIRFSAAIAKKLAMVLLSNNTSKWRIQSLSRYFEINYCCCKAKLKSYFRVGWDYRFKKWSTIHGVHVIPCSWILHETIYLWPSTCHTYHRKGNI